MRITLRVWRQGGPTAPGRLETYVAEDVSPDMSFLEMLDVVNEGLIAKRQDPIAFDSDCREGICGACVAQCKNASAALFTSAKISHLALLPQGQPERYSRAVAMVERHDAEGFGSCSNEGECEAVCPKEISITNIARMNRDYLKA